MVLTPLGAKPIIYSVEPSPHTRAMGGEAHVYRIVTKETLTPVTKLYEIEAPEVARKARAG
jgi:hypothetical protein